MREDVFVPMFKNDNGSTRDRIVFLLSMNSPLTVKKLHHLLKKNYSLAFTYQAVHKLVKQLVDQQVLVAQKHDYSLNPVWIAELKKFIHNFEHYSKSKSSAVFKKVGTDYEIVELSTFREAEYYFFKYRDDYFENIDSYPLRERILCLHAPHLEIAINSPRKEYDYMAQLLKNKTKHYTLVKGNTLVDKWVERFYNTTEGHPYLVKCGANCSSLNEVWIYPDKLIEVFFSDKFWQFFDTLYSSIDSIEDINHNKIIKKLYKLDTEPVRMVIHKNKSIINLARKETLKQFGINWKVP